MEVKVRYDGPKLSDLFGIKGDNETIHLSDEKSTYGDLLDVLREKYKSTVMSQYHMKKEEPLDHLFDSLFIVCGGRHLLNIKGEKIDPSKEVLVYSDLEMGG